MTIKKNTVYALNSETHVTRHTDIYNSMYYCGLLYVLKCEVYLSCA